MTLKASKGFAKASLGAFSTLRMYKGCATHDENHAASKAGVTH